jgi:hypothetical protein
MKQAPVVPARTQHPHAPRLLDGREPPPAVEAAAVPAALGVARGVARLFGAMGLACLPEVPLKTGRRLDLLALGEGGQIWAVEIKSSVADFRADKKWPEYLAYCERLYFAVPPDFPTEILPDDQGLIVADAYDARILREVADRKLAAARRKALTLRFARLAARRLSQAQGG